VIRARVAEMLKQVQLAGFETRRPRELSGGQSQRVALARALVLQPRVLLLDEPFSNLDAHLREDLRTLVLDLQRRLGLTTIVVTHDQQEAVMLADRVAVLFDGQLQQVAPPRELYTRPASLGIARFFGNPNVIRGLKRGAVVETALGALRMGHPSPDGAVALMIRPERILLADGVENTVCGEVTHSVYLGTHLRLTLRLGTDTTLDVLTDSAHDIRPGQALRVTLPAEALWPVIESA